MVRGSVIASSTSRLPHATLRGYALVGGSVVIGDRGMRSFGEVVPGADGAYVSVVRGRRDAVIGTDALGYGKLFLYREGDRWAVGSSLIELAEYVSGQQWRLDIDEDVLLSFTLRGPIGNQLTSPATVFSQIRLLPANAEVVLERQPFGRTSFRLERIPLRTGRAYTDLLRDSLDEMTGRMRALVRSGIPMVSDITGGRDSRAVLASLLAANDTGHPISDVVRFRSDVRLTDDFDVATSLSDRYALAVNRPPVADQFTVDPQHGYRVWRRNDLGVYGPIYPFRHASSEIPISGAGGESHRLFYKRPAMHDTFERARSAHLTDSAHQRLATTAVSEFDDHLDERVAHYRGFRDRFHGGRNPIRALTVAPLATGRLRLAADRMPAAQRERGQVLADIMMNLHHELADLPFDSPAKHFDAEHRAHHTRVVVDPTRFAGTVHGSIKLPPRARRAERSLEPFAEAFSQAIDAVRSRELLPAEVAADASQRMERAADSDRFAHAVDGQPVSLVILAAEAARLTT